MVGGRSPGCGPFVSCLYAGYDKIYCRQLTAGRRGFIEASRGRIEVWCIQELMSPNKSGSSTEEKARVLPPILADPDIVLVIAFGTAASPTTEVLNGSVLIWDEDLFSRPESAGFILALDRAKP